MLGTARLPRRQQPRVYRAQDVSSGTCLGSDRSWLCDRDRPRHMQFLRRFKPEREVVADAEHLFDDQKVQNPSASSYDEKNAH